MLNQSLTKSLRSSLLERESPQFPARRIETGAHHFSDQGFPSCYRCRGQVGVQCAAVEPVFRVVHLEHSAAKARDFHRKRDGDALVTPAYPVDIPVIGDAGTASQFEDRVTTAGAGNVVLKDRPCKWPTGRFRI